MGPLRNVVFVTGALAAGATLVLGCTGQLGGSAPVIGGDAPGGGLDAGTSPTDTGPVATTDAPAAIPDTPPPAPGTCPYTDPMATPIAGCMPAVMPSTGDPHEDCVRRINQFRCECQHLPPLARWVEGEACADMMARYDHDHPGEAHAAFRAGICSGGYGQNECPGWGSVPQTVSGCLQQMWDEGPGDFYGPPAHGHYLNMSSTSFSGVACGFYEGSGGVYALQNFH